MTPVPEPDACRACGDCLRGSWEFAPDDRFCGLCGREVLGLAFHGDVARGRQREVWLYAADDRIEFRVWALHGSIARSAEDRERPPPVAVLPDLDLAASRARFEVPGGRMREFTLKLAGVQGLRANQPAATLAEPARVDNLGRGMAPSRAAAIVRLAAVGEPIRAAALPVEGIRGELRLAGVHGETRQARLIPLTTPLLKFSPPGEDGAIPELVGYQAANGEASVEIAVTARVPVLLCEFNVAPTLTGIEPSRRKFLTETGRLPFEFTPGREVRIQVTFVAKTRPEPQQPLTVRWLLAGVADPVLYRCLITLRPQPHMTIRPLGTVPEEVTLGGRPVEFELLLEPTGGDEATVPELRQPELVLDPPGDWLKAEPFPVEPHHLRNAYSLRLTLNTSKLDRARTSGRDLTATVRLEDQAGTRWEFPIRTRAVRMKPFDGVLGIDWGTTNTCAAHTVSADSLPQPISLPPPQYREDPPDYEQFPSALYIEDLSDPANPVFHLGPEARTLANRRGRPECLIHSLKRRFLIGNEVYARDEAGREHAYPVAELTRLVLLRLVELAEHELGREVRHLGFTFPTKWPAAARRRFAQVLREVAAIMSAACGYEVRLDPPDIDEANAVALNVLHARFLRGRLPTDRTLILVAYDFGGGTIDTSVLEVRIDETANPPLTTRYLGIGGTSDFGGDEVTRAVVLLLQERINAVLSGTGYELPLRRAGDPPEPAAARRAGDLERTLDALRNWEQLRQMAEEIKRRLCQTGDAPSDGANPVRDVIESRLTYLLCYPTSGTEGSFEGPLSRSLNDLVEGQFPFDRGPFFDAVRFALADVYAYPLPVEGKKVTVAERVTDTFNEIGAQLVEADKRPADLIVLAGGGCRLPLVAEMVRTHLPPANGTPWDDPDRLIYDQKFAKQRVAHGKAAYLAIARDGGDALARGLARSVEVLHRAVVVMRPTVLGSKREVVVRVGESVSDGRRHSFTLLKNQIVNEAGRPVLWLHILSWETGAWVPGRVGYFALEAGLAGQLPPAPGPPATAEISLIRSDTTADASIELRLDLWVRLPDDRLLGPYPFVPQVPPAELIERIQGSGS